ncbi:MAG TPA: ATP-binding protein [Gemmatimonadaceae bacterium]
MNEPDRRRRQELGLASNDLMNLLSNTNLPAVMVGLDHRIRRLTPPAGRVMNLRPADVGRSISDVGPAVAVPDLDAIIDEVIDRGEPSHKEVQDRHGHWYVLRVHPCRRADSQIDGAVVMLVDLDQKRSDDETLRRQSALLELSLDAVIVRDADDRIVTWNRGAREIYGWTAEQARGRRVDRLLNTDRNAWAELNRALDETGSWDGELEQLRRDGAPILVHCREVLVRDAGGSRSAVLAIKRDITESRRAIESLREADRRKDEFLATLAHELRNPLAPIRNALEIMRLAGDDDAAVKRAREVLDRQVTQLARIVEDLIDVARIVERKIELRKECVPLRAVVDTAVESCRSLIGRQRQTLSVDLPPTPLYIDADPVRISQVFVNLLNNAARYTQDGGRIWVTAEQVGDDVAVRIGDNGSGIPGNLMPRLFEMFTQGERATRHGSGGMGVGLAVVRSFVEMHRGSVEARSEGPGNGSEFTVWLPLADAPAQSVSPTQGEATAVARSRILVLDDNDDQAQSLALLLTLMGHDVRQAASGPEAIDVARDFLPDLMLVDIGLAGMPGHEVARRIRSEPALHSVRLVAHTGWGGERDRLQSREAGFDDHLVKPLSQEMLRELLQRLADRSGDAPA